MAKRSEGELNGQPAGSGQDGGRSKGAANLLSQASGKIRQINPAAAKTSTASGVSGVKELASMAVSYAKQETVGPLKGLGRYAAFGFLAAVFFATGLFLIGLGALRGIQAATGALDSKRGGLDGNLSWIPYLLAVLVCIGLLGLIALAAKRAVSSVRR